MSVDFDKGYCRFHVTCRSCKAQGCMWTEALYQPCRTGLDDIENLRGPGSIIVDCRNSTDVYLDSATGTATSNDWLPGIPNDFLVVIVVIGLMVALLLLCYWKNKAVANHDLVERIELLDMQKNVEEP